MSLQIVRSGSTKVPFSDLRKGELFIDDAKKVHMRCKITAGDHNAINLHSGESVKIHPATTEVSPVRGVMKVDAD